MSQKENSNEMLSERQEKLQMAEELNSKSPTEIYKFLVTVDYTGIQIYCAMSKNVKKLCELKRGMFRRLVDEKRIETIRMQSDEEFAKTIKSMDYQTFARYWNTISMFRDRVAVSDDIVRSAWSAVVEIKSKEEFIQEFIYQLFVRGIWIDMDILDDTKKKKFPTYYISFRPRTNENIVDVIYYFLTYDGLKDIKRILAVTPNSRMSKVAETIAKKSSAKISPLTTSEKDPENKYYIVSYIETLAPHEASILALKFLKRAPTSPITFNLRYDRYTTKIKPVEYGGIQIEELGASEFGQSPWINLNPTTYRSMRQSIKPYPELVQPEKETYDT